MSAANAEVASFFIALNQYRFLINGLITSNTIHYNIKARAPKTIRSQGSLPWLLFILKTKFVITIFSPKRLSGILFFSFFQFSPVQEGPAKADIFS